MPVPSCRVIYYLFALLTPSTQSRYQFGLALFEHFCEAQAASPYELPED